jgi:hypothetical protein
MKKLENQHIIAEIKAVFTCKYRPKKLNEKSMVIALLANVITIIIYVILTAALFTPGYVGYTIGTWLLIAELSFIVFTKYY